MRLFSEIANKPKYHLCVHINGHFLLVNSPKVKSYPGDLNLPCSDLPFLTPTPEGVSVVSCNLVLTLSEAELKRRKAVALGAVSREVLLKIVTEIEASEVLSDEDREKVLAGLDDWI